MCRPPDTTLAVLGVRDLSGDCTSYHAHYLVRPAPGTGMAIYCSRAGGALAGVGFLSVAAGSMPCSFVIARVVAALCALGAHVGDVGGPFRARCRRVGWISPWSSRPRGSHPRALSEPCVNVSPHTARPNQPSCTTGPSVQRGHSRDARRAEPSVPPYACGRASAYTCAAPTTRASGQSAAEWDSVPTY